MDELLSLGMGGVGQFLQRWYGTTISSGAEDHVVDVFVPNALAEWHSAVFRTGVPVTFHDHPIALRDLCPEPGGMLPFWVENQHGFYWAVDIDDSRHRVFCRESGSSEWRPIGEYIEKFLLHCTIREAVIGAANKFTAFVGEPFLGSALESFSVLDFPALASEELETRIWSSVDALARVTVPPVGYERPGEIVWMVTVAVARDSSIENYGARFGVEISDEIAPPAVGSPDKAPPF